MSCGLVDVGCHIQSAAWEFWSNVGILNKVLIVGGVLALALGVSWSLLSLLKRLGGWPAVLGAVAVIVGVVLAMLPQKPKPSPVEQFPEDHPDTKGPFEFGVNKTRPKKKKRPTIFDR
ncbi:MAG: hypothetical protein EOO12_00145 [Chitinophagaceae bacterium]|nr:MAG: hypothetical protein EOO12_00145 [Chitinophagaceae bacterium]